MRVPDRVSEVGMPSADYASVRAELIAALSVAIASRDLSQVQASKLLRTDQPTLSKVLRGRTESVSIDKLLAWLLALGRSIEIRIGPTCHEGGRLRTVVDGRVGASK